MYCEAVAYWTCPLGHVLSGLCVAVENHSVCHLRPRVAGASDDCISAVRAKTRKQPHGFIVSVAQQDAHLASADSDVWALVLAGLRPLLRWTRSVFMICATDELMVALAVRKTCYKVLSHAM